MMETLNKRFGRTAHAIHMLTHGGIRLLKSGETPFPIGTDEEAGFISQRETLFKNLIRTALRTDTTSTSYHTGILAFSVHTSNGVIYVDAGIMKKIGLATFPYSTGLNIYDRQGRIVQQYTFVGNPKIQG